MKRRQQSSANPLFEKWLEEWKDYAAQRNMSVQYNYEKALSSLRQYPLPLRSGKECLIIRYFGPKLCKMLDKKLEQYRAQNKLPVQPAEKVSIIQDLIMEEEESGGKLRKVDDKSTKDKQIDDVDTSEKNKKSPNISSRPYIPKVGSAAYAILVTLYKNSLKNNYAGFMLKKDIISEAQDDCECEMNTRVLNHYAGWSSMSSLVEKNLVARKGSPAKFWLTDTGLTLAKSLHNSKSAMEMDDEKEGFNSSLPSSSRIGEYKNSNENNDIIDLSDDRDDDVFQKDIEETENAKLISHEKVKNKILDKGKTKSVSNSDDDYDKFCKENPEPVIAVKRKEQHFIFTNDLDLHSPTNEINTQVDSQYYISKSQKKKETAKEKSKTTGTINRKNKNSVDETPCEPFFLLANNFDIILLVDTQETCGGKTKAKDDATISELSKSGILFEVRSLKVGDFLWIAKCRHTNRELVLPYIIERKRMDDLSSSIKDGRYHEQKFRLRQSGIDNVIYMVENYGSSLCGTLPLSSLLQAAVNSLIQDNFDVKFTKDHRDSMRYLSTMTRKLTKIYEDKELWGCLKKDLQPGQLIEFNDFNKAAMKTKNYKVQQMMIRQLLQLKGVSTDKAIAIAELYSTPKIIAEAFRQADDKLLSDIESGPSRRKLGSSISKTFYQLYTNYDLK